MWGQLLIKALISGAVVALASETARRNPGIGGLIASLPLVSPFALFWLWRDTGDPARIADFAVSTVLYVMASMPAFLVLAWLMRRGTAFPVAMGATVAVCMAGYFVMGWVGGKAGWPV